jgi:hypothetical protein
VVVGGIITVFGGYAVASQQAKAAQEEALWTQRLTAYSQFMADSEELRHVGIQFVELVVKSPSHYSKEAIVTVKKPVDEAASKVIKDVSVISLIGSLRASVLANRMLQDLFALSCLIVRRVEERYPRDSPAVYEISGGWALCQ